MIHGNPTWSFYFRVLIQGLSSQCRAIAVDHIGCGLSDKPDIKHYDYRLKSRIDDLETLLKRLKIKKRITLVLHDWGGIIGMAYAVKHPERVSRLVVLNTAAFLPPDGKKLPLRLWLVRHFGPLATPAVLGFNLFARLALIMAPYNRLTKDVKAGLTAPYNNWQNRMATLKFVQDIPVNKKDHGYSLVKFVDENLNKLAKIPMLICWGMHDFVFDASYLAEWERRFPDAKIYKFSDAGHYILEDVPSEILAAVQDFFKKHPA